MRLFLAIFPSPEFMEYFRDVKRALDKEKRNLRFIPAERIHLTARFIGSRVDQPSKNALVSELHRHSGSYPKPELDVEGVSLGFPKQRDPRVIMANIAPDYELEELIKQLHKYIRSLKRRDMINWKQRNEADFHISLARLKPAATKHTGVRVQELIDKMHIELPPKFTASEMHLMSSEITPKGPVYRKLEVIKL